jgi:hypothetical protein
VFFGGGDCIWRSIRTQYRYRSHVSRNLCFASTLAGILLTSKTGTDATGWLSDDEVRRCRASLSTRGETQAQDASFYSSALSEVLDDLVKPSLLGDPEKARRPVAPSPKFKCPNKGCSTPRKEFLRKDNFQRHIRRCGTTRIAHSRLSRVYGGWLARCLLRVTLFITQKIPSNRHVLTRRESCPLPASP